MDVFYCISYDTDQSNANQACMTLGVDCSERPGFCCSGKGDNLECKANDDGQQTCQVKSTEDYSSIFSDVINTACKHEGDTCSSEGDQGFCCDNYLCVKNEKGELKCHNEGSGDLLRSLIFD